MGKYRMPTDREVEILRRNGIDPENLTVSYADDSCIRVLKFKTRDEIFIYRGCKERHCRRPNDWELGILRRNGINTDGVMVYFANNNCIGAMLKTRNEISVYRGDKQWS